MARNPTSPIELRAVFGCNLRKLAKPYRSISDLSRSLGINRTQFNRYLSGESFPRPDVLARICSFFDVDARILLEPVEHLKDTQHPINDPFVQDYLGRENYTVPESLFPSGFFRFSRRSFLQHDLYIMGLVHVRRHKNGTYIRGYEASRAARDQQLSSSPRAREFRGVVMRQDDGLVITAARRKASTCSFNYLDRAGSYGENFWTGYVARPVPERLNDLRVTRLVFEHIGKRPADALPAARSSYFVDFDDLPAFHRRLLMPDVPFS